MFTPDPFDCTRSTYEAVLKSQNSTALKLKRRLAAEYDAAQDRGEVRTNGERTYSAPEKVGPSDIGLTPKEIHEARNIRDAEAAAPS